MYVHVSVSVCENEIDLYLLAFKSSGNWSCFLFFILVSFIFWRYVFPMTLMTFLKYFFFLLPLVPSNSPDFFFNLFGHSFSNPFGDSSSSVHLLKVNVS